MEWVIVLIGDVTLQTSLNFFSPLFQLDTKPLRRRLRARYEGAVTVEDSLWDWSVKGRIGKGDLRELINAFFFLTAMHQKRMKTKAPQAENWVRHQPSTSNAATREAVCASAPHCWTRGHRQPPPLPLACTHLNFSAPDNSLLSTTLLKPLLPSLFILSTPQASDEYTSDAGSARIRLSERKLNERIWVTLLVALLVWPQLCVTAKYQLIIKFLL